MTRLTEHWQYVRQGDEHLPLPPQEVRAWWLLAGLLAAIVAVLVWE